MPDDLGKESPIQSSQTEADFIPPEIKASFEKSRRLGTQLTNIDQDRRNTGCSSFRDDFLLGEFSHSLVDVLDSELSDEVVLQAQKGSFGLTLEGAKQIKNRELIQPNGIKDDMESLTALIGNMSESSNFAEELRAANPIAYSEVAKKVVAVELGKKPEEVVMDGDELAKWVKDTYEEARQRLIRQADALRAYLDFGR